MHVETRRPSAESVIRLIESYKHFAAEIARQTEERAQELKARLSTFWPRFQNARAAYAESERREASRFDLLRLLGLVELERTHSRILADLLNPRGTHGQSGLFLESFLDHVGLRDIKPKLIIPGANVEVSSEHPITGGRPDIVVRCVPWLLLVIENKIKADENLTANGVGQLEKYREWLNRQAAAEKRLFFLTIHGDKSRSGVEDIDISYLRDVHKWLEASLKGVAAPAVQHMLLRYLHAIEDLRNLKKERTNGTP